MAAYPEFKLDAFWFFFAQHENLIFALEAKLVRITHFGWPPLLFYHKSKDISVFFSSTRNRTRKFSLRPANFLLHIKLWVHYAQSILERVPTGLDLRLLRWIFFPVGIPKFSLKSLFHLPRSWKCSAEPRIRISLDWRRLQIFHLQELLVRSSAIPRTQ